MLPTAQLILSDARGELIYYPGIWSGAWLEMLDRELIWQQDLIKIFGRSVPLPRLTAWYGDSDAVYRYSGIINQPRPWHPLLQKLKAEVEQLIGARFNAVLANRYADGQQHQGYHADDESELGPQPVIASLSFGATRRFLVKERSSSQRWTLDLADGSLLVMRGAFQQHFVHALAKTARPVGLRINLTYRHIETGTPANN